MAEKPGTNCNCSCKGGQRSDALTNRRMLNGTPATATAATNGIVHSNSIPPSSSSHITVDNFLSNRVFYTAANHEEIPKVSDQETGEEQRA